jgi:hypothetical protein
MVESTKSCRQTCETVRRLLRNRALIGRGTLQAALSDLYRSLRPGPCQISCFVNVISEFSSSSSFRVSSATVALPSIRIAGWARHSRCSAGCSGATAYPRARGVWRDDEREGALVFDEPIVIHCYTTPADIEDERHLAELGTFCRRMGRETNQGEVGLIIADEYIAIRDFVGE